jgi:hypothetical protein
MSASDLKQASPTIDLPGVSVDATHWEGRSHMSGGPNLGDGALRIYSSGKMEVNQRAGSSGSVVEISAFDPRRTLYKNFAGRK